MQHGSRRSILRSLFPFLIDRPVSRYGLEHVRTCAGHKYVIHRPEFSPDGSLVATPNGDGTIGVWRADSASLVNMLHGHTMNAVTARWLRDCRTLYSISSDGTIRAWDTQSGRALDVIELAVDNLRATGYGLAISPDESTLIAGTVDALIRVARANPKDQQELDQGRIRSVAWSPAGHFYAYASDDGIRVRSLVDDRVRVFPIADDPMGSPLPPKGRVAALDVAWSESATYVAASSYGPSISVFQVRSGRQCAGLRTRVVGRNFAVTCVRFIGDGLLCALSQTGLLTVWRTEDWKAVAELPVTETPVDHWPTGFAFDPTNSLLATSATGACTLEISRLDAPALYEGRRPHDSAAASSSITARHSLTQFVVDVASAASFLGVLLQDWANAERTTAALVFTDIVGSTSMNVRIGNEAMTAVRRRHFDRVRALVAELGGCEVKTLGDGFFLVFRSSVDALDFGLRLQTDTGDPTVEVRVGIHVGIFRIEEHDAFGSAVNYAARVAATANAGEIVASERVLHDIREERLARHHNLNVTENPECELKGFRGVYRLWTVRARG